MAGRPRLPISTFGAISTTEVGRGRFRATTRFRDWDGQSRKVTASGATRTAAETALKVELAARMRTGNVSDSLNAGSPFTALADAWLEDLRLDVDRSDGTKIGDGNAYVQNVEPGAVAKDSVSGVLTAGSTLDTCKIVSVSRTAAL